MEQADIMVKDTIPDTNIFSKENILHDYLIVNQSRQLSLHGRKEVLTGKAKFGIFGDGKEVAQVAFAKFFKNGDWRSGYYRDQTFVLSAGLTTLDEFFAQLYGHTDLKYNPSNGGRNFNNHFSTRSLNENGEWKNIMEQKNSCSDLSPTAGQMPRLVGLAWASKLYRQNKELREMTNFSKNGNEVAFGMIGDASTSEGHFFETLNAAGVLQIPMAVSVWDDGYGISVPKSYQTVKQSISEALQGFKKENDTNGILIYKMKGWNYPELVEKYKEGIEICRKEHIPVLFHIEELTQPLGHSTSGSHERYKDKKRLAWEAEFDAIKKMKEWILSEGIASEKELANIEDKALADVKAAHKRAWQNYQKPIKAEREQILKIIANKSCVCKGNNDLKIAQFSKELRILQAPLRRDNFNAAKKILRYVCHTCDQPGSLKEHLNKWVDENYIAKYEKYNDRLYCESKHSALNVKPVAPLITENSEMVTGREVLKENFDKILSNKPEVVIFGEDSGKIGGVNQCLEGLQEKHGKLRLTDTGIRETTIVGKGIGLALRGLRPIAEIQYFDYILYGLQTLSDDLSNLHWRTVGGQVAPVIIRTRGHRLEGIWHSGSPLSMVINSIRGMYVCVPRNMTQAAGMYNTLLEGHDPALIIEPLNSYRLKELMPENIGEFRIPLGQPDILTEGDDLTLVTYGSCVRIALDAIEQLREFNIKVELIDVQTLLPFDISEIILESVKKTGKVLFFDEDVPGGATAYMMQKVVEEQGAYPYLNVPPKTLSAMAHRPAYSSDGDYFSNPNAEDLFESIYNMMHAFDPVKYPSLR